MNCHFWKATEAFNDADLCYQRFRRVCKDCEEKRLCRGECGRHLSKTNFTDGEWKEASKQRGRCKDCMKRNKQPEMQECLKCNKSKAECEFSKKAWTHPRQRYCTECALTTRGQWTCIGCKDVFAKEMFAKWLAPRANKTKADGKQRCNTCMEESEKAQKEKAAETFAQVWKPK